MPRIRLGTGSRHARPVLPGAVKMWDFEDGSVVTVGPAWSGVNSTAQAHGGTHAMLGTRTTATAGNGFFALSTPASGGTHTLSLWARPSTSYTMNVSVAYYDGLGAQHGVPGGSFGLVLTANTWTQGSFTFTYPGDCVSALFYVADDLQPSPAVGQTVYLDDAQLVRR